MMLILDFIASLRDTEESINCHQIGKNIKTKNIKKAYKTFANNLKGNFFKKIIIVNELCIRLYHLINFGKLS